VGANSSDDNYKFGDTVTSIADSEGSWQSSGSRYDSEFKPLVVVHYEVEKISNGDIKAKWSDTTDSNHSIDLGSDEQQVAASSRQKPPESTQDPRDTQLLNPQSSEESVKNQIADRVRKMIDSVGRGNKSDRRALVDLLADLQCNIQFALVSRIEIERIVRESDQLQADDQRLVETFDVILKVFGNNQDGKDISCEIVHLAYPDLKGNWCLRCMDEAVLISWERQIRLLREKASPANHIQSRSQNRMTDDNNRKIKSTPEDKESTAATKLKLAKTLLQKNPEAGERRLKEIIDNYPGTKASDEARERMAELQK
jgi:hypothetical protein